MNWSKPRRTTFDWKRNVLCCPIKTICCGRPWRRIKKNIRPHCQTWLVSGVVMCLFCFWGFFRSNSTVVVLVWLLLQRNETKHKKNCDGSKKNELYPTWRLLKQNEIYAINCWVWKKTLTTTKKHLNKGISTLHFEKCSLRSIRGAWGYQKVQCWHYC